MVTFRNKNNTRRNNFRRNDRNYKSNNDRGKFGTNFSNNENFQRKIPGRNNHNASKLIEKYKCIMDRVHRLTTDIYESTRRMDINNLYFGHHQ